MTGDNADTYDNRKGWYYQRTHDGSFLILTQDGPEQYAIRTLDPDTGEYERTPREIAQEEAARNAPPPPPPDPVDPMTLPKSDRCTCYHCARSAKPHKESVSAPIIPLRVPGTGETVHVCLAAWSAIGRGGYGKRGKPRSIEDYSAIWFSQDRE
jgi:hypothetical protein